MSSTVRRFFGQPMFMSEDFTGVAATWVDRAESERELAELLDGASSAS